MNYVLYILIGLLSGVVSGFFGIGGGTVLVPAFVLFLGMSQHMAQGTALAVMLPPVFAFAVWEYYKQGFVDVRIAVVVALAFLVGALVGGFFVQNVPDAVLKKMFGVFLVLIGIRMMF